MRKIKEMYITPSVKYTKVEFHDKIFRRFQYIWKGKTMDVQWLDEDTFVNESFEKVIEQEFKEKVE